MLAALALPLASGCKRPGAIGGGTAGLADAQRGAVTEIAIPNDQPAYVVRSTSKKTQVIVYLPPRCEEVVSTLESWGPAGSAEGVIVMMLGDQPCPGSTFRHFSIDAALLERRLDAVVATLAVELPGELDASTVIIVGYSEGAPRAEAMIAHAPKRFSRAVLIGAPEPLTLAALGHARAVATMAGDRDRRDIMMLGVQTLQSAHVPAKFFLLPHASHGEFGPDGGRVMTEAIQWLVATAP